MELTPNIYLLSLGCAKNLVDSEVMLGVLSRAGYRFTTSADEADIIVVNTCAFIDAAVAEATEAIRSLACYKRNGRCKKLVVCGCLPQRFREDLPGQFPEVDLFLGTSSFQRIDRYLLRHTAPGACFGCKRGSYLLNDRTPRVLATPPGSAYIKIAEGCSHRCTYCTIPAIRGPYQSRSPASILREAQRLASHDGVRELNLIAQDTSRYPRLASLLVNLARIPEVRWIRLLYGHPLHLHRDTLRVMADEEKMCRYLDLPLQHIADSVLKRMGRRTTSATIRSLLDTARKLVPELSVRTTLMVGFPGETDQDFQQLLAFVHEVQFDHLGVFAYRDEPGTAAARMMPKVPENIKQERVRELMRVQANLARARNQRHRSKVYEVLISGPAERAGYRMQGRTMFQAPEVDGVVLLNNEARPGDIVKVRIIKTLTHDLIGTAVQA